MSGKFPDQTIILLCAWRYENFFGLKTYTGFTIFSLVNTVYGVGYIAAIREDKNDYVVKLTNWKLAQGQSPTLYLQKEALK